MAKAVKKVIKNGQWKLHIQRLEQVEGIEGD